MPLVTEIQVVGVEDARRQLIEYFNAYKSGTRDIKELNKEMREIAQPILGMRRALNLAKAEWQLMNETMIEAGRIMRDIGRIGRTITSIFTSYTVGQIRLARAQKDVKEAQREVAEAQARYNRYLQVFGENSVFTQRAYEELQRAIERQKEAEQDLQRAQQETMIGYVGMTLQIGELIATIPTMIKHVNDLRIALSMTNASASTLTTTLGTIGAVLGGIFLGVEAAKALTDAFGELGAAASIILGVLTTIAAITAAIALNVSIATAGFAALAGIAAFGAGMAAYGAYKAAKPESEIKGEKQYGGFIPETGLYTLHAGEYVIPANNVIEKTTPKITHISNTFYIDNISSEIDIERVAEYATKKMLEKLDKKW